jgi:hypothetical protein
VKKVERRDMDVEVNTAKKKKKKETVKGEEDEDKYLRMAIEESLHTAEEERMRREERVGKKQ